MNDSREWRLIERCKSGDVAAYTQLVRQYQKAIYNCTLRILDNPEDAADATQVAFLRLYERISSFDTERSFFSWMYRIAINAAIDQKRRTRHFETYQDDVHRGDSDDPDHALEAAAVKNQLQAVLMQLTFDARAVLVLRHYSDFSYKQISNILEIPEKTVRSRLYAARQQLKMLLQSKKIFHESR